jgi:hypothetical protein
MFQEIDFSENLNLSFQTKNNPETMQNKFPKYRKTLHKFQTSLSHFSFFFLLQKYLFTFFGGKKFLSLRNEKVGG